MQTDESFMGFYLIHMTFHFRQTTRTEEMKNGDIDICQPRERECIFADILRPEMH
jgi:hypothetical protein